MSRFRIGQVSLYSDLPHCIPRHLFGPHHHPFLISSIHCARRPYCLSVPSLLSPSVIHLRHPYALRRPAPLLSPSRTVPLHPSRPPSAIFVHHAPAPQYPIPSLSFPLTIRLPGAITLYLDHSTDWLGITRLACITSAYKYVAIPPYLPRSPYRSNIVPPPFPVVTS